MANNDEASSDEKIVVRIDPDLEELIPGYLKNRENDLQAIQAALDTEDFEAVQQMGHTMKGSGGGYGFDFISAIGMALEEAAKKQSHEKALEATNELADFLKRVQVVYE
jgi:HPt (histidine-containing phosphotransfer) domain-containing protein